MIPTIAWAAGAAFALSLTPEGWRKPGRLPYTLAVYVVPWPAWAVVGAWALVVRRLGG